MRKHITKKDTANMIRKALKEAFPDLKFSVVSSGSSMCSVLNISWEDGANETQVSSIVSRFKGASFEAVDDSKEYRYHMLDGEEVSFYFDYINLKRSNSDAAIQRAIDQLYRRHQAAFELSQVAKPTVSQFNKGELMSTVLKGFSGSDYLQSLIWKILSKNSDRLKINHSPTAAKVFMTHHSGSAQKLLTAVKNFDKAIMQ